MAAIDHTFVENNTPQNTSSTSYGDVTGSSIADGSLIDGKKYLIVVSADLSDGGGASNVSVKVVHGSTDFDESVVTTNTSSSVIDRYSFMTVWTAVAGEGLKLQWKISGAGTALLDHLALEVINLTDNLTEGTDWIWDGTSSAATTDVGLSATPVDGASVTFTPSGASDWLVLSYSYYDITSATDLIISRIERSGEATSATPEARYVKNVATSFPGFLLARAYALTAASNTFKEVSACTATSNTRLQSNIVALNMNKFRDHVFAYTDADVNTSATDYATALQTANLTPSVASDVWIVTYWGADINATNQIYETRIQVDNTDQPANQTSVNYQFDPCNNVLATAEDPVFQHTMVTSMTAAAHTIDLDGSTNNTTNTPSGQHRTIAAFTMELAALITPELFAPVAMQQQGGKMIGLRYV